MATYKQIKDFSAINPLTTGELFLIQTPTGLTPTYKASLLQIRDSFTGYFYPTSNPSGYVTSASAGVISLNGLANNLRITGAGNVTIYQSGASGIVVSGGGSATTASLYIGSGDPNGVVSAVSGSLYTDYFNLQIYMKTGNGTSFWV